MLQGSRHGDAGVVHQSYQGALIERGNHCIVRSGNASCVGHIHRDGPRTDFFEPEAVLVAADRARCIEAAAL